MMRILIAQTTRMGDVLQTSPLIRMVRQEHPDAHISLLVRRMGRIMGEHHPDVDEVLVHEEDALYQAMKAKDSDKLLHAFEIAETFLADLRQRKFDLAYNVTHSIASAMMMKLAGIPEVVGAHLSDDWHFVLRGRWTAYFFTSVFTREYNDLNLCDILKNFAAEAPPCRELVLELKEEDRAFAQELRQEHGIAPHDFVACMQLGASETNKRWAERRFAELAKMLQENHNAKIFLLGVTEEAALGDLFEEAAPGLAIPLYGKTSIPQVAALLETSTVLITNDTGTMHIAAAMNCPVTLVSVGHVHYRETGPYGAGHCALEWRRKRLGRSDYVPGGLEERDRITPQQVYRAVRCALAAHQGDFEAVEESPEIAEVDLFITRFSPDGCLQFYPAVQREMSERDFIRIAYRAMWLDHLNPKHKKNDETQSLQCMLQCYNGPDAQTRQAWAKKHHQAFEELSQLAQQGAKDAKQLLDTLKKNKDMRRAKELVSKMMSLDEDMNIHAELHPACTPLIRLARYERDNLEGGDPQNLSQDTLQIYQACYNRARLMSQKIKRVTALWQQIET
jgi:ADP-heptose:LPS heptosyltransferase